MSYTRPSATAANASWESAVAYTRPSASAADATWAAGSGPSITPVSLSAVLPGLSLATSLDLIAPIAISGNLPALSLSVTLVPPQTVDVAATLPGLTLAVTIVVGPPVHVAATLPALTLTASALYDSRTARPTVGYVESAHQQAEHLPLGREQQHQQSAPSHAGHEARYQQALLLSTDRRAGHTQSLATHQSAAIDFQGATPVSEIRQSKHALTLSLRDVRRSRQQSARRLTPGKIAAQSQDGIRTSRAAVASRAQIADRLAAGRQSFAGAGMSFPFARLSEFQDGIQPQGLIVVIPPVRTPCYTPSAHLLFDAPADASPHLVFICDNWTPPPEPQPATIIIPTRRIYMQINTVTLARADTGQEITAGDLSLSIDVDSWSWAWSASVPASYLVMLTADPGDLVEVIATVNGTEFRLAVESVQRDRSFAKSSLRISGRSRAAWLASPLANSTARRNTTDQTAQQLMAAALTENGVSLGWALDWQITDWLVPAGAWSHTGSAIEACTAIASAAGGYIQAHRKDQTLHVLPRYPAAPWDWPIATPDIEIPEAVSITEGIEYITRPHYNRAFVSGTEQGIIGQVTRTGTAGNIIAPLVTDPLITHADAARQRGISILGDTGRQKHITLSLPILAETGIIPPGKLVRYIEQGQTHIGITRAVNVAVNFPKARQTVRIESHVL
jgi:hypothetical protein